ncbi:hypothetical protein [Benzoatithermus flavus]|uniref:Uncharacterized protein n=1 Tax=Benzoatithermus flavus TaxID=3108223 RepID=A0ABU8XV25_9PROT
MAAPTTPDAVPAWAAAVGHSSLGETLRSSLSFYPTVETLHIVGLALLVGAIAAFDVRMVVRAAFMLMLCTAGASEPPPCAGGAPDAQPCAPVKGHAAPRPLPSRAKPATLPRIRSLFGSKMPDREARNERG